MPLLNIPLHSLLKTPLHSLLNSPLQTGLHTGCPPVDHRIQHPLNNLLNKPQIAVVRMPHRSQRTTLFPPRPS